MIIKLKIVALKYIYLQESPVTPYQIKITAHSSGYHPHYFRVMVDGVKVKGISMEAGQSR